MSCRWEGKRPWVDRTREILGLVIGLLFLVSIILVIIALLKHRPSFMVPHMIMSVSASTLPSPIRTSPWSLALQLVYIVWVVAYLVWFVVEYTGRASTEHMLRYVRGRGIGDREGHWGAGLKVVIQTVIAIVMSYLLYIEYCCYVWMGGSRAL